MERIDTESDEPGVYKVSKMFLGLAQEKGSGLSGVIS
jgi:hypothetical protein